MERDKIVLITGASGAIGSSIALSLAKNGFDLVLHYHDNIANIEKISEVCRNAGVEVTIVKANLEKYEEIERMFGFVEREGVQPNILINAAGIAHYGLIQDVNYTDWNKMINTNIMSAFFCAQKVIPKMLENQFGRIINISSVWGEKGAANEVIYSLTKGAINAFTKALARELAPSGITVNAIAPGIVMTKMMESFSEVELQELKEQIPMNRFANADEIAEAVLYLLKPNASYLTGQIITIDGSWT